MKSLVLGEVVPTFSQENSKGVPDWHSYIGDDFGVLITIDDSHSLTSKNELEDLKNLASEFSALKCKLAVLSTESLSGIEAWLSKELGVEHLRDLPFVIFSDQDLSVCELYHVRVKDKKIKNTSILVVSPEKNVLSFAEYPPFCQRNWSELLRVLHSFNTTRGKHVATPVDWVPGEQLIVFPQLKVLITGATGTLGRHLMKIFSDCEVYGWGWSRASGKILKVDLSNEAEVREQLDLIKPTAIIHTAAMTKLDVNRNEPERTRKVNVDSTQTLAAWAKTNDSFLLYISSDNIFDGKNPPYKPNSKPNPVNSYGRNKWDGEQALWSTGHNGGVLRVPLVYGPVEDPKDSVLTQLVEKVRKLEPLDLDNWSYRYPTFVGDVGYVIKQICLRRTKHCGFSGTWHWSSKERYTEFEIGKVIAEVLGISSSHLHPINEKRAEDEDRPIDPHLLSSALEHMGFGRHSPFRETLQTIIGRIPA